MSSSEIENRLELARVAGREAGQLTLTYFQKDVAVDRKSDNSPVTVADREAEQLIRRRIEEAFPADGILGEEFPEKEGTSGYRWILDPIDGTKSFIHGVPLYGTMVAVEYETRAVVGVVEIPGLDECVYAATGCGAWLKRRSHDPVPAKVNTLESLSEGVLLSTRFNSSDPMVEDIYANLEKKAYMCRTWGDCYGYLLVATGRAVAMMDPIMSVWDAAALQPILEEAGGTFTDWNGTPTIHNEQGLATNGLVLEEIMGVIRDLRARSKPASPA